MEEQIKAIGVQGCCDIVFICVRSLLLGNLGKRFIFSPLKPYECFLQWGSIKKNKKKTRNKKLSASGANLAFISSPQS